MTAEFRMQNGEWITVHVMQSSTKEYDLFAFHKATEMQRRIQSYEERLMLLTAGQYTASLKPLEGRIGTTVISAVSGGKLQHIAVYGGIALEVYEERTVQRFLEHLVTTNKNTSFKTRFKLHYAGLLYPWFARAQKAQLTD